jgi:hypothetical protein
MKKKMRRGVLSKNIWEGASDEMNNSARDPKNVKRAFS